MDYIALFQLQVVGDELQYAGGAFGEESLVEGAGFGGELGAARQRSLEPDLRQEHASQIRWVQVLLRMARLKFSSYCNQLEKLAFSQPSRNRVDGSFPRKHDTVLTTNPPVSS